VTRRNLNSHSRAIFGSFALAATALVSACLKSTEPQPPSVDLKGEWKYTGTQTSPVRETLTGTLTISGESGNTFVGRLDLVAVSAENGQQRVLAGIVSGAQKGADVIDFDANLETNPRRHVGQVVADTVSGPWVGTAAAGSVESGTFRIERQSQ
jgi:hypothetical protein